MLKTKPIGHPHLNLRVLLSRIGSQFVIWCTYLISSLIIFLWFRRSQIVSRYAVNPDEAELLASGKRGSLSWIPYSDYSTPTFGPIWPTLLGLLHRLGTPLTVPMAHLISAVAAAITCAIVAVFLHKRLGVTLAILIMLPIAIQWALGFYSADFVGLATEVFSVFFLVVAVSIGWNTTKNARFLLLSAFFLSLSFWSKYQFGLLVIALLLALWRNHQNIGRLKATFLLAVGFVSLPTVMLSVSLISGTPLWKLYESIQFTKEYALSGGLGDASSIMPLDRISSIGTLFFSIISATVVIVYVLVLSRTDRNLYLNQTQSYKVKYVPLLSNFRGAHNSVLIFVAGLGTLYLSFPFYPHYAYALLVTCLLCIMVMVSEDSSFNYELRTPANGTTREIPQLQILLRISLAFAVVFVAANARAITARPWAADKIRWEDSRTSTGARWDRAMSETGWKLTEVCPSKSRVIVWGWSSELYSYYDWIPASRYPNTVHLMTNNPFGVDINVTRERFLEDLEGDQINCVVNAIGPGFFASLPPENDIKIEMPEIINGSYGLFKKLIFYWDAGHIFDVYVSIKPKSPTS